jgi:dTMP kinase
MPSTPSHPAHNPTTPSASTPPPWLAALAGKFIVFEGADGSGKSTQLTRFAKLCSDAGLSVCQVREPGGTDVGERIRTILLDKNSAGMTVLCEMLLFMASRAQLVEQRIAPALARGDIVLTDRFTASTYAYQGSGGGVPDAAIASVARVACGTISPDLTLVFDLCEDAAARRTGVAANSKAQSGGSLFADRMEERDRDFFAKVRKGYLDLARREPDHHAIIDASGTPDQVWSLTLTTLEARLTKAS